MGRFSPVQAHRPSELQRLEPRLLLNATLQGQLFEDLDGNGRHDPLEPGLDAWTVELLDDESGAVVATTTTARTSAIGWTSSPPPTIWPSRPTGATRWPAR